MGRIPDPGPDSPVRNFGGRRLKLEEDPYRLRPAAALLSSVSFLKDQKPGDITHLWGFIGHAGQLVIVGPDGPIAIARRAIDARLDAEPLREQELSSRFADAVRFVAGTFPVRCQFDKEGRHFLIKLPKDLEHIGSLPAPGQHVMLLAIGEIIEVWKVEDWKERCRDCASQIHSLVQPTRLASFVESDSGD